MSVDVPVAVVGAGPYALSTATFLRSAGVESKVFGEVMGFWHSMPTGMFLRSFRRASNIADPDGALTLSAFEADRGHALSLPISLADFLEYGHWFQRESGVEVDTRRVEEVTTVDTGFRLRLSDGVTLDARRVVVAAGITPFAWKPPLFDDIDGTYVSHSSEHQAFDTYSGKRVLVVGGGQSALESAALLHESGAEVEIVVRRQLVHFLRGERLYESAGRVSALLYPSWGVGPPGINWVAGRPALFRLLPDALAEPLAYRATRPAGAAWLRPRLEGVRVVTGRHVISAETVDPHVRVVCDDGSERDVDHILLGTGYRLDLRRYAFLGPSMLRQIRLVGAFPKLSATFECSVPGIYFVGMPAAASAGPGMRFVSHTGLAATAITRGITQQA